MANVCCQNMRDEFVLLPASCDKQHGGTSRIQVSPLYITKFKTA